VNLEFLTLISELSYDRLHFGIIAGVLVSIVATLYAVQIYRLRLNVNIATWGMILLIDVLGLILAFSAGNREPYIHLAWVTTDILICSAIIIRHPHFAWSRFDTASLLLFLISLSVWMISDSELSVFGYLIACFFTLLPQARQYFHDRRIARKSSWIWIMNCIALVMTILSVPVITYEYSLVSLGLLVLNLGMVMIALR
jgi:hypothetical protein